jgi:ketosteroid isomerase-like protein
VGDESEFERRWLDFLKAFELHDDAGCLTALQRWEEEWDRLFLAGDFEAFTAVYHPDVEIRNRTGILGTTKVFRGYEGFKEWRAETIEVVRGAQFVFEEFQRLSDDRFMVHVRSRGTWRFTGIPINMTGGGIWTLRERKIATVEAYRGRRNLLKAAGLRSR